MFFQGEITKYDDWGGPCIETGKNDGERQGTWKSLQSTYDVVTNKGEYRFAIQEYISDTGDPKNIGINSLYIIKSEDSDMQYAYRGDGEWTQGIIIVNTHE